MENTKQSEPDAVDQREPDRFSGVLRSRDAFLRDLPALLANPKYDRWSVAYCGDDRIILADSRTDVIRECERRGLHADTYFVGCIYPHGQEDEEVEFGGHEIEDIDETVTDAPINGFDANS